MIFMRCFVIFLFLGMVGCGQSYRNYPPELVGDWVAYGDSLTLGYGVPEGGSYPERLSELLGRPILNLGRSGRTTGEGLAEMGQIPRDAAVVFLCLGGNDELQRLPREQLFSNLSSIIEGLQDRGAFVVLLGVRGLGLVDPNRVSFERLAKQKSSFFIPDILEGVWGNDQLMFDSVHPNEKGYQLVAQRIFEEFLNLKEFR